MKNKKIINILLLLIFLILGFMVRNTGEAILFDAKLLEFIHTSTNPTLFKIMKGISYLGSEKFIIPFMLILISFNLFKKNIAEAIFLLVNSLGSFGLNCLLKEVFQRTRPLDFFLVKQGGLSYPSGHSMVVMSMYLACYYLLTRNIKDKNKKFLIASIIAI